MCEPADRRSPDETLEVTSEGETPWTTRFEIGHLMLGLASME
jgi:hypothetical protein